MRIYNIILSDIRNVESDQEFKKYIDENNFEWWRHTALNWILLTPDNIFTNTLIEVLTQSYGTVFFCVMEISIKDVGGLFPTGKKEYNGWNPFLWFHEINEPSFIPKWEREKKEIK